MRITSNSSINSISQQNL